MVTTVAAPAARATSTQPDAERLQRVKVHDVRWVALEVRRQQLGDPAGCRSCARQPSSMYGVDTTHRTGRPVPSSSSQVVSGRRVLSR